MSIHRSTIDAFLKQSVAVFRSGDVAGAHAVLDRALELDGRDLRALLAKADLLASTGEHSKANTYYRGVVEIGGNATNLASDLIAGVARAKSFQVRMRSEMGANVQSALAKAGYEAGRTNPRFTHAMDLMTGRRKIYMPQPGMFYYPELPAHQFYPRDMFPWMDAIEAETAAITDELMTLLERDAGFSPYLATQPGMTSRTDYPLVDSLDWSSCSLFKDGELTDFGRRCPRTMAALAAAPLCKIEGRSPQAMFSQLKPGAHILPHHGFVNTRLTCHLPLIVPPGCSFRVGNDVRQWETGKVWVFDDTIEHEARNDGDRTRVVLIFDIWRPELTEEERRLVATLLETIDSYSPSKARWD